MRLEPPMEPFIRIVGQMAPEARPCEKGAVLPWELAVDAVVPEGSRENMTWRGEVVGSDGVVEQMSPQSVERRQGPDLERFDDQHSAMKTSYERWLAVDDLSPGDYTARVWLMRQGEVVAQDELALAVGLSETELLTRIKLPCKGGLPRAGDLDGDGDVELLHAFGARVMTAYRLDGEVLWDYRDPQGVLIYNTAPTRVYDIDGDGCAEVICMRGGWGDLRLCVLDGATGRVRRECEWPLINELQRPDPEAADYSRRLHEIGHAIRHIGGQTAEGDHTMVGSKVTIADFTGRGPGDLLVTTGEQNCVTLTAMTRELEALWSRRIDNGRAGHTCWAGDVDGDGRDEVAAGTMLLDHDGTVLWEKPFEEFNAPWEDDHIDAMRICDVNANGRPEIVYSSRLVADAETGRTLWVERTHHGQEALCLRMRDDLPGRQVVIHDRNYRVYGHLCYGATLDARRSDGRSLWQRKRLSMHLPRPISWLGGGLHQVAIGFELARRPTRFNCGVFDGRGRLVGVMPRGGFGCDITGNGADELVSWTQWPDLSDTLEVYTNAALDPERLPDYDPNDLHPETYNEPD